VTSIQPASSQAWRLGSSTWCRIFTTACRATTSTSAFRAWQGIKADALDDASRWVEGLRRTWEGRLDQLGEYLQELQQKGAEG
jgi:hypothetical protein